MDLRDGNAALDCVPIELHSFGNKIQRANLAIRSSLYTDPENGRATVAAGRPDQRPGAEADQTQADLAELLKTLEDTRGLVNDLQVLVRANGLNTTYTIENLRMATDNLNDLTQSVKERPWSLVRIRQPKDRKVPK
jgi:hypothetical protein